MIKKIFKYIFLAIGIWFGLVGIFTLTQDFLAAIIILVIAGIFLYLYKKLNKVLTPEQIKAIKDRKEKEAYRKALIKENKNKLKKQEKTRYKRINFKVAGTFLGGRQANINKYFFKKFENGELSKYENLRNSDIKCKKYIDKEVYEMPQDYKLEFEYPQQKDLFDLTKEPDNEHDSNAISVYIRGMGTVGYVPKTLNVEVGKLLDENKINKVKVEISGGNYKMWDGEELSEDREDYEIYITLN